MKKDIVQFMTEKYTAMTNSEKTLADYIINNFEHVLSISVQALAAELNISVATIVRFAQHLGFEGYKDFRLYLAQLGSEHEDFILDFHKNDNSPEAQISRMLSSCAECLNLTSQNIDYNTLSDIVQKIQKADKIAFFGVGTSFIVCQDASVKFKRIGISTECACESTSAALTLLNMKKGDVVFGVSHSGNNETVESILKTAQKAGITTVAVTTFSNSNICKFADYILLTQTRESPLHKIAITSRVSQFAMMDSLFMAYLTVNYDKCIGNVEKTYEITNDLK
ncbi:MAG: MurR/RpiR family transcriptional regulator [Clostridia bacterium]|nr:MurR/RpiR family transcriptional regulator [Clostridia bacterium]